MAFSKSQIPFTAQHYLVCGTEDCGKNYQFYCNDCHRQMCEQCRDEHQKIPDTKSHEVVPYQQRQRQLPEVKCQIHVNRYEDMLCEQCQVPVCSKCAIKDHGGHTFIDLERVYAEKCAICLNEINKIEEYFLPTSQDLLKSTKTDSTEIKKIMESICTSMRAEAESLKSMVDAVTSDRIKEVNEQEKSLLQLLNSQDQKYNDYISYLNELVKKCYGYLSSKNLQILMSEITKNLIDPIPETTKPVPPVFTAGQYSKKDVTKLLGRITVPDAKPEIRKIKPMETASTQLKPTEHQRKQDREKSDVIQTLSLSSYVTKVREYTVPGVKNVHHVSLGKSGRLWGSDDDGSLVQTDLQGDLLQKIQTSGRVEGYHTVTRDGDLIFTDKMNKVINRITVDNTITAFIKTGGWEPFTIHSSHINGDILVGMMKGREAIYRVTRYKKTGKKIQNIQRNNKGRGLYDYPHYITENINGDICTSDWNKRAVVVVNKSGQHRFSYRGQGPKFRPYGICTDLLGHIIVCDGMSHTVDILNQDGQFLSLLLTEHGVDCPRSMCVDDENNLHVGQYFTNIVTVYKYLQ